jgi:hypothetical protein
MFHGDYPMQENEDKEPKKHPIEMTSDELLDLVIAPEVTVHLRAMVQDCDDEPEESESVD